MTGFRPIRVKTAAKVLLIFDMCKYSGAILVKMFIFPPIFVLKCYNYAVSLLQLSLLCFFSTILSTSTSCADVYTVLLR